MYLTERTSTFITRLLKQSVLLPHIFMWLRTTSEVCVAVTKAVWFPSETLWWSCGFSKLKQMCIGGLISPPFHRHLHENETGVEVCVPHISTGQALPSLLQLIASIAHCIWQISLKETLSKALDLHCWLASMKWCNYGSYWGPICHVNTHTALSKGKEWRLAGDR